MKKLIAAAVLYLLLLPVSYSMGWFHRHDDSSPPPPPKTSSNADRPGLSPNIPSLASPAPEPETYLVLIVGLGLVAWVIRNKMK